MLITASFRNADGVEMSSEALPDQQRSYIAVETISADNFGHLQQQHHVVDTAADRFSHSVDRFMVHRRNLAEIFLSDVRVNDDSTFTAAAQLPYSHAYYGDHLQRTKAFDPLLLLEASRQLALYLSHHSFGVPFGFKFILTRCEVRLDPGVQLTSGNGPAELDMNCTVLSCRKRDGEVKAVDFAVDLKIDPLGTVGRAMIGLAFKAPDSYVAMRLRMRAGRALPSSANYAPVPGQTPADPAVVGRRDLRNVVITSLRQLGPTISADLCLPAAHQSMFDHPQDHIPGMVLAEAARQLAVAAVGERHGYMPSWLQLRRLSAHFRRFGELEPVTQLNATVRRQSTLTLHDGLEPVTYTLAGPLYLEQSRNGGPSDEFETQVEVIQDGEPICSMSVLLGMYASGEVQ